MALSPAGLDDLNVVEHGQILPDFCPAPVGDPAATVDTGGLGISGAARWSVRRLRGSRLKFFANGCGGIMDVAGSAALAAVAAGGNGNDHRRSTRRMPLVDAIAAAHVGGQTWHLDLIRFRVRSGGTVWSQFAHSYVGFGLTPLMAVGLDRDRKGAITGIGLGAADIHRIGAGRDCPVWRRA